MLPQPPHADPSAFDWKTLCKVGGIAALLAGILFRRNLGVEIALFSPQKQPAAVADWFALLQTNRLLGLAYLGIFDVLNYALLALMFLALYFALRRFSPSLVTIAGALAFLGITVYCASNTALSLLALSDQYAAAASDGGARTQALAAGQALLALNRFSAGAQPGSGGYFSLLLVAAAGLLLSGVMLRNAVFNRVTAYAGIAANGLDLVYCLVFALVPGADPAVLAVSFIPAAGLFFMLWHILIGVKLFQLGRVKAYKAEEAHKLQYYPYQ